MPRQYTVTLGLNSTRCLCMQLCKKAYTQTNQICFQCRNGNFQHIQFTFSIQLYQNVSQTNHRSLNGVIKLSINRANFNFFSQYCRHMFLPVGLNKCFFALFQLFFQTPYLTMKDCVTFVVFLDQSPSSDHSDLLRVLP